MLTIPLENIPCIRELHLCWLRAAKSWYNPCFCHSNESTNTDQGFTSQQRICSKHWHNLPWVMPSALLRRDYGPYVERVLVSTEENVNFNALDEQWWRLHNIVDEIFSCGAFNNDSLCLFWIFCVIKTLQTRHYDIKVWEGREG